MERKFFNKQTWSSFFLFQLYAVHGIRRPRKKETEGISMEIISLHYSTQLGIRFLIHALPGLAKTTL